MKTRLVRLALAITAVLLWGCQGADKNEQPEMDHGDLAIATFAGGCFWCVEAGFEKVPGVSTAISGYTGGHTQTPTYEQVSSGTTGHREAVQVFYDPELINYEALLQAYWRMVDPTDAGGQFSDRGQEYTTAIWYHTPEQRIAAEKSKAALDAGGRYQKPVVTPVLPASRFYEAEDKHQDYYKRQAARYEFYRYLSGRDSFLEKTWGDDLQLDFHKISAQTQPSSKPSN